MARVTLKTIAQKAGVSASAVSLALSGKGNISKAQQERIRKIADELGYMPNPLLASLASKRFRSGEYAEGILIAVLEFPVLGGEPTSSLYQDALEKAAKRLGYQARIMKAEEMKSYSDVSETLYRCGTQGVIITGQPPADFFKNKEAWNNFSIVQCGRSRQSTPVHTVRSDIFRSIKLLYTKLRERGYKRIGFGVGLHPEILEDDEARTGSQLSMLSLHTEPENYIAPYMGNFFDKQAFLTWADKSKADCFVTFNVGQYYLLKDAGYKIPDEFGFATPHLHQQPDEEIQFAGLLQNTDIIAEQSVTLLDQLIRYNNKGFPEKTFHMLVPSQWIEGNTLRPLPSE